MIVPTTNNSSRSESDTISRLCQISRTLGWVDTSGVWKATSEDLSAVAIVFLTEDLNGLTKMCCSSQFVGLGIPIWAGSARAGGDARASARAGATAAESRRAA